MKRRWIIVSGLVAAGVLCAVLVWASSGSEQKAVQQTRLALRAQGFKTDVSEFDFSASDELRARAALLTRGEFTGPGFLDPAYGWPSMGGRMEQPDMMRAVGTDAALVVWQQEKRPRSSRGFPIARGNDGDQNQWSALAETLSEDNADLDAACAAALAGPIRFNLDASHGSSMLLPHLAALKSLAQLLGTRALCDLHNNSRDAAWINLMASTRLVTAWEPEPAEVSLGVRFVCASLVYGTTWQALQAGGWSDDRLASLQREWEAVDFFKRLPETAAFKRASSVQMCQLERQQPLAAMGLTLSQLIQSPRIAWYGLSGYWRQLRYRHHGSYEDEKALLLFYRGRELELRRAVQAPNWLEMRQLPGVTNPAAFQSKYQSRMQAMMNIRRVRMGVTGRGQTLLSRAAEAEARRRLLITAIALERYHRRHGSYPATLQALVPELLPSPPMDFMDGKPLRYRLTGEGHFVLYSVGLDCVDDGRKMQSSRRRQGPLDGDLRFGQPQEADLVWPRPASVAEAKALHEAEEHQAEQEQAAREAQWAEGEKEAEAERQAVIEKLLAEAQGAKETQRSSSATPKDPVYQGHPLSQLLRNDKTTGTNKMTLHELLTLKQVFTGAESDRVTFEVPIRYEAATNIGRIHLLVDGGRDVGTRGEEGERQTCERATNGNCLLGWTTTHDPPGRHAIQAEVICTTDEQREDDAPKVRGPAVLFVSTNLYQFSAAYDSFTDAGATLYAKLAESNGVYSIELISTNGAHLKTLTGRTSNGVIKARWNLIDDHGQRYTNESFDSVFTVTLPDSGLSQTMKGP
jgi:hypothetical protein